ncbi:MAG: flagellar motor protein [Acidobacteriaceae bacterium]
MTLDKSTTFGIMIGLLGIGLGATLEGGTPSQIFQPAAALIVLGGTLGAVMVQFPVRVLSQALIRLKDLFLQRHPMPDSLVQHLLRYAYKARKEGLLSLDNELVKIQDPFLRESLMLAIDGVKPADLRKMMELQLEYEGEKDERIPKVFDAAGGFAPTFGILGAVLGLIQVMQRLQNMDAVGKGIAVAFVATIYGVGAANLLFLPMAGKLRIVVRQKQVLREMTLEAVLAIVEGVHPRALEQRLNSFGTEPPRSYLKVIGQ